MRKNAVMKTVTEIDGGLCAPYGFQAVGVHAGLNVFQTEGIDLGLLVSDNRFQAAFLGSKSSVLTADVAQSKTRLKSGKAQAILVHGVPTLADDISMQASKRIARTLCEKLRCGLDEILIVSCGELNGYYPQSEIENNINTLIKKLDDEELNEDVSSVFNGGKECAYAGMLGAFPCKVGVLFKGASDKDGEVGTCCVMTTDVNVTAEMLGKALRSAVAETLEMTDLGVERSPCDSVCIVASAAAGNCRIDCADSEYKKFCDILKMVLCEIATQMLKASKSNARLMSCKVQGCKSQRAARAVANSVVRSQGVKRAFEQGGADLERIIAAICGTDEPLTMEKASVLLRTPEKKIYLFDQGQPLRMAKRFIVEIVQENEFDVCIDFNDGNYGATARTALAGVETAQ